MPLTIKEESSRCLSPGNSFDTSDILNEDAESPFAALNTVLCDFWLNYGENRQM